MVADDWSPRSSRRHRLALHDFVVGVLGLDHHDVAGVDVEPALGGFQDQEILVVAGLADVVRTTAQRARGSPLDQYLPWYIVQLCGVLSEKFTESLNSIAGIAAIGSDLHHGLT